MKTRSKGYQEAVKLMEKAREYSPEEAIELAKKMAHAKFDETVELHLVMGVDPRNSAQQVRGVASLPHGLGKTIRILVFAQPEGERIAREAGADHAGSDEIIPKIEGGWLDFDVAIATPDMMGKIGKLGKILGRKGLMPNPKSGTVVQPNDLPRAIAEARKGRVEFKLDRTAIIHLSVGKVSFDKQKLLENLAAVTDAINKAKPAGVKGQFVKTATLTTTMGPGIRLDVKTLTEMPVS